MSDSVSPTSRGCVGGEDRCALADDLPEHAPGHRDGLRRRHLLAANPRHDGHVRCGRPASRGLVVVLAEDHGDVRGARHQDERAGADRVDHVAQLLGRPDALLHVVERAQAAVVALDGRLRAPELVDLAHREDARLAAGVVRDRDRKADHAFAGAQLDDVSVRERHLAAVRLVEYDAAPAPDHRGAVGRPQVAQDVPVAREHDHRVLARHVLVRQDDVSAVRPPDADDPAGRLVTRASRETMSHLEADHARAGYTIVPAPKRARATSLGRAAATPPGRPCCPSR